MRPLDPLRPEGTQIDVQYVVVPAAARHKLPDPVFMLGGEAGQSAIGTAASMLPSVQRLNNRRDIVFIDRRGVGRSAPLECEGMRRPTLAELADAERQVSLLAACRERLVTLPHGDLRQYTTAIATLDLEAVRQQLGATRINLVGSHYGARAALDYLRQFPQTTRRVVIDGVVLPDMALPASLSTDAQAALNALFDACERESGCGQAYPRLREDWAALLAGLPASATVKHPLSGRQERITVTRDLVLSGVRGALASPSLAAVLPQAMTEARQGNYDALAGMNALYQPSEAPKLAMGMHFSAICAEDLPRTARAGDSPGRDFGSDIQRRYERVCADWPRGEVPPAFYEVPPARSAVLLLSGGLDPVAPPRHGERAKQALGANALHVVVPTAGQGVLQITCMPGVLFRFIDAETDRDALGVDTGCAKGIPRPSVFRPPMMGQAQ